jgi:hypothetical protein
LHIAPTVIKMASNKSVKLSAKWQLDAALLSRPVDLTALVTMSRANPDNFTEDNTLNRLVNSLLNEPNSKKSDRVISSFFPFKEKLFFPSFLTFYIYF